MFCRYPLLTLVLLNTTCHVLANSIDPDQLASEEANLHVSGSAQFANKVNVTNGNYCMETVNVLQLQ